MNLVTELSTRLVPQDHEEIPPVSEVLLHGQATDQQISGALLEAAVLCQPGYLLFMSDDTPFEDMLSIVLLDTQGHMLDSARLGGAYTTGSFEALQWQVPDIARFRFIGDTIWSVRVLPRPQWRIPILSEPMGVWRSWGFSRHFIVSGKPKPQIYNKKSK